jgi:hypothetical protein
MAKAASQGSGRARASVLRFSDWRAMASPSTKKTWP